MLYIFEVKKGIIILMHGMEGKEGIERIISFFYFCIITLVLVKMLLLKFLRRVEELWEKYLHVVLLYFIS